MLAVVLKVDLFQFFLVQLTVVVAVDASEKLAHIFNLFLGHQLTRDECEGGLLHLGLRVELPQVTQYFLSCFKV